MLQIMFKDFLVKVTNQQNLTEAEAVSAFQEILEKEIPEVQIAAFLGALRGKGETAEEILGCVRVLREKGVSLLSVHDRIVDTCGTGGDQSHTFNVSTAAAFVAAGAGVPIAKHGNRSVSSQCGSSDVLEALGIPVDIECKLSESALNEVGLAFLFAPLYHPVMKKVAGLRRDLGIKTIFNIAGPLSNPVRAQKTGQVLGVFESKLLPVVAEVLKHLGVDKAWVVHSKDGLDEISNCDATDVALLENGKIQLKEISPEDVGLSRSRLSQLKGTSAEENARIITKILDGEKGAPRDIVLLNAAAACVVGEKASDLKEGIVQAKESVDSGKAKASLNRLKEFLNKKL